MRRDGTRPGSSSRLDMVCWTIATVGLALWLRSGPNARFAPLFGLVAPGLRWAVNADYRRRIRRWVAEAWEDVEAWSRGADSIPWRAALAFAVGPYFLLQAVNGASLGTFDTRPVIPTTVSLVRQGDVDLREFEAMRPPLLRARDDSLLYCFQDVRGRLVSSYPSGMVPLALATVAPAYLLGADLDSAATFRHLEKGTAAAVAALALGLFFLAATRLGSPWGAIVTTVTLAFASGLLTTVGLGLWQHGGVVTWLLAALLVEFAAKGSPGRWATAFQGFALAQMVACRPTAGLVVVAFGVWVLVRSPRRGLWLGLCGVVGLAPWLVFHRVVYGNLIGAGTIASHTHSAWSFFALEPMLGVLFSPARGLFVYQPWALLAIAAIFGSRRGDAGPAGWRSFCLTAVALHVVLVAAWWEWAGGYCYGSRLLTDVLPLLALAATPVAASLMQRRSGRAGLAVMLVVGLLVQLPCITNEAHRWNLVQPRDLWGWSTAPFFYRG
ncbi:hypothetical protein [Paludisphaera rhizosphaerae]|uniref:hypothetical protein n=1 Tax=Paludisphaera rhizosphaerae TaxID=2711216 RepID=UPI0013EA5E52|nr:hypothetical protein [Paludisphaera rhizosphaerae]